MNKIISRHKLVFALSCILLAVCILIAVFVLQYEESDKSPEKWFPYNDCEYLGVDNLSETESNALLADEFRQSLYAINNGNKPLNEMLIFSENNIKQLTDGICHGGQNFNVAYCFCAISENKAIIDFQVTNKDGELNYQQASDMWMKKVYLEHKNGSWAIVCIFTGGG